MRSKMKYLVILTQLLLLLLLLLKIKYLTLVIQSKKIDYNRKINEVEKKISDNNHVKYITTPEFNKLTAENLVVGLAKTILASKIDIANLVKKTDFDDKL